MRRFVIGTAGHIDHGKTALVRALTGHDRPVAGRKRRGISIDGSCAAGISPDLVADCGCTGSRALCAQYVGRGSWCGCSVAGGGG